MASPMLLSYQRNVRSFPKAVGERLADRAFAAKLGSDEMERVNRSYELLLPAAKLAFRARMDFLKA